MSLDLSKRKQVLEEIFPDFTYNPNRHEFITWCYSKTGCAGNHHKKKLQINIEDNVFNCWVCGYSGFITRLLRDHATKSQKDRYLSTVKSLVKEVDVEVRPTTIDWPEHHSFLFDALDDRKATRSYEWLRDAAGASDEAIFQQKIGWCYSGDYGGRLIFPSFSKDGNLNFYSSRDIDRMDRYKYLNGPGVSIKDIIFNEILIDWSKPIIIFEGIKSYLKHLTIPNVIPIFGTRFNKNFSLFKKTILEEVPCVYLGLDNEAKDKSFEIMKLYDFYGIESRLINLEDVNQSDNLDTESVIERISSSRKFSEKDSLDEMVERIRRRL